MHYFSSRLGTLIITMNTGWWLCIQDLLSLSQIHPFLDLIFVLFLFSTVMELKKGHSYFSLLLGGQYEVSEKCLARYVLKFSRVFDALYLD